MATVLDLPGIIMDDSPHLMTLEVPTYHGSPHRTHVAAVWGDLHRASGVVVQPMSETARSRAQTWRDSTARTSTFAAGLAPGITLIQWLGCSVSATAQASASSNEADPIDRDAVHLVAFDHALARHLPKGTGRSYLGCGPGGYLLAEALKRGLCPPTAIAFSDTPALGRQARRTFTGEAMTVGGALIHAREPITCLRDLNPNLGDIPVLVVTDGRFEEAMAFSSPPQNLTDVIVAANHPDSPQSYRLPRHISPTGLRKFVLTVQHAASTSSAEAQRNLLAFLNGQLDQVRVAYRDDGSDARPAFPGVRLDGVPMAPMFNRDHTGDMAQLRNTRPTGRGRTSRPRGKPDGYHSRAGKGAEREL